MRRFEGQARLVRRGPREVAKLVAFAVLLVAGIGLGAPKLFLPAIFGVLSVGTLVWAGRNHRRPGAAIHGVRADAAGLSIDGAAPMDRAAITSSAVTKTQDGYAVHVHARGLAPSYSIVFEHEAQADELLRALRLDERSNISRFRALPPWARHLRWLAVVLTSSPWILLNFARFLPLWAWGLIALSYAVIGAPLVLPQRVEVGRDGILIRWMRRRRFIPFTQIEDVKATPLGNELELRGGHVHEIRLSQKADGARAERTRLYERIREGLGEETDDAGDTGLEESMLAQGSRDLATWLRDMQQLGAGGAVGYRVVTVPHDRLWAIVENLAADPSAREGAAIALHASLDDDDRMRIADLAQGTASPRLRVAFDGVSRATDETRLRIALDAAELEEAEPPSENVRAARALPPRS